MLLAVGFFAVGVDLVDFIFHRFDVRLLEGDQTACNGAGRHQSAKKKTTKKFVLHENPSILLNFIARFIILEAGDEMNKTALKPKIILIGGPTAVGKSALAVKLAQQFNGEVINGDAYQIYRGMDIGTAKVTPTEMDGVPHHLIDIVDPGTPFTAAQFQTRAGTVIQALVAQGKLPIVVGGTGFYLNALAKGLPLGVAATTSARQRWEAELAAHGEDWLHDQLAARDPAAAAKIPAANSRRVVRALEVIEQTGQLFSAQSPPTEPYQPLVIGLTTDRALLYRRIEQRVDQMMQQGLLQEVAGLLETVSPDAQAFKAIGYKELVPVLQEQAPLAPAVALIKQHSRNYAKRQLTYFRNQMPTNWFDLLQTPTALEAIDQLVASFIKGEQNGLAR